MDESNTMRIAILGKTGVGKSSLANTITGEQLFTINHSLSSERSECRAENRSVNGRSITFVDTPGLFDTHRSEEELRSEIVRCIIEYAPGPHAFLIVLKVEKFTEQEQDVITRINQYFSEEVFRYATVVFTHGDQLPAGQTIEDLVQQNSRMRDLVRRCGGRCHVIDNKYWNRNSEDEYRSNQFQVEALLNTLDKMVMKNNGRCYTNKMLQVVQLIKKQEEERVRQSSRNMSETEIREQARRNVFTSLSVRLAGVGIGVLLGALFGVAGLVVLAVTFLKPIINVQNLIKSARAAAAGIAVGVSAAIGGLIGGITGYHEAEGAETPLEAARRTAEAVKKGAQLVYRAIDDLNVLDKKES
ncbi:GTPase IMAP family member 7-like [Chaetodon trifascialis]|uniref:GTPase IMAP family member 7-like n=1 Tax=Chaetodon trifascialis TaxID=109706 RepID=UPI0039962A37